MCNIPRSARTEHGGSPASRVLLSWPGTYFGIGLGGRGGEGEGNTSHMICLPRPSQQPSLSWSNNHGRYYARRGKQPDTGFSPTLARPERLSSPRRDVVSNEQTGMHTHDTEAGRGGTTHPPTHLPTWTSSQPRVCLSGGGGGWGWTVARGSASMGGGGICTPGRAAW